MIKKLYQELVFAGVSKTQPEHSQSVRISNILSLLACGILVLQLPLQLALWSEQSLHQSLLILVHAVLLFLVPGLNRKGRFCQARVFLLVVYSSYIALSSFNYHFATPVHYFFLIALFAIPFLHFDLSHREIVYMMLWFLLAFLFWETNLIRNPIDEMQMLPTTIIAKSDTLSFGITCFLVGYFIYTSLKSGWKRVLKAQHKTQTLLLNILPEQIALKLEHSEQAIAEHFDCVTILFADIENFSRITREKPAPELVSILNQLFSRFDRLARRFNLEKIKTIGDQYMAVSGLPESNDRHALQVCQCAIRMQEEFILWSRQHHINCGLRIGINSGPVIAGVIGIHKFSYDLWGEAVNLASRMESQGTSGKIQVTEATYDLVKGQLMFEYQETIEVKGMGRQNVYWIDEPYSV